MPSGWGSEALWRWKHSGRPGFEPEDVVTVRIDGEMAACFHVAVMPMQLEDGLVVSMGVGSEYAILPEHRKRGISLKSFDLIARRLLERRVALRGGFTSRELHRRLYQKRFGHIFAPTVTREFRKILGLGPLRRRLEPVADRLRTRPRLGRALARVPWIIGLDIEDLPVCHLEASGDGLRLNAGRSERSDLEVQVPYQVLTRVADGTPVFLKSALSSFLARRLRIGGFWRSIPRLLRFLGAVVLGASDE
jgi:hypothetical protein